MQPPSVHVPVMLREVLHYLQLGEGLTVVDGTVGAGGHSSRIAEKIGDSGRLLGFDRDPMMLQHARQKLSPPVCQLFHGSYTDARRILQELEIPNVDRVLLDLGLSSDQLADRDRGFGFDAGGPLDMRFDVTTGQSAADILNHSDPKHLEKIFSEYGEEPFARRIAASVCERRRTQPLQTTTDLEHCVRAVIRDSQKGSRNPATRVFQALRIAANQELEHVRQMMTEELPSLVKPGGLAVIISFHSLEDRIVKSAFKGKQGWQVLTKTPIEPTPAEVRLNPRSRSARLRVARRIEDR